MTSILKLEELLGFEWDKGNLDHIKTHDVTKEECEEIFTNRPMFLFDNKSHSEKKKETRWGLLGITDNGRKLTVFFTVRNQQTRVISARDQSKKDRALFLNIKAEDKI